MAPVFPAFRPFRAALNRRGVGPALLGLLLSLSACGPAGREKPGPAPSGSPPRTQSRDGAEEKGTFLGTVQEVLHAGGYTYARIQKGGEEVWVAGPETTLGKGERLAFLRGVPLEDFHCKSLGRTFRRIYFVSRFRRVGRKGDPGGKGEGGKTPERKGKPGADRVYTVALLWKEKNRLSGKTVRVRGIVTKVNAGIMGKNWIHLADRGAAAGEPDLVFTTKDRVKEGEKVLVRGMVGLNRDFGYGYRYELILEDGIVEERGK